MPKIKEKPAIKDPKVIDKVSRIPKEVMRRGLDEGADRIHQNVQNVQGHGDTPEDYAADKIEGAASDGAAYTKRIIENAAGRLRSRIKTKESYEQAQEGFRSDQADEPSHQPGERTVRQQRAESSDEVNPSWQGAARSTNLEHGQQFAQMPVAGRGTAAFSRQDANAQANQGGKQHAQRTSREEQHRVAVQKKTATVTVKSPVNTVYRGQVKTAQNSVKTTGMTTRSASKNIKTAERTAKATAQTVKQTAKMGVKTARVAAKAAAQASRAVGKAAITAVKAILAAVKGLVVAIVAGGWVAVVVILAIGIAAAILCSAFGIFYSNESGEGKPMTDAINEIDAAFKSSIDSKIAELSSGGYDTVNVIYQGDIDGDSMNVTNWSDVLNVYAVMLTTNKEVGMNVVVVTPEKLEKLKAIFNDMNKVNYRTETVTTEETVKNENVKEETVTKTALNIYITFSSLTYLKAANLYGFTDDQREILEEMMSPSYYSYFASLLGVDLLGGTDLTKIISNLPVGTEGAEAVKVALTKLGAPYVMGAKGDRKFDCSGLAYWAINQVDPKLGAKMYTNAAGQAKWCISNGKTVGRSELQPGDLIFWQNLSCPGCGRWNEIHHVGIYIGDGKTIEASSSRGRVVVRDLWSSAHYPIYAFARPYV